MLDPTMMYSSAVLRARGHDARGGVAGQARPGLREARPRAGRPPAGDRHRLGRPRRPRRGHPRLPRHDHHDLPRAARRTRSARVREAGRRAPASRCSARTTATCAGTYTKLASIEMIEAVGHKDFGTFFSRCDELLEPGGAMLLQAITIDDRAYAVERASQTSFIRTHIFPNGCLPSLEVIARRVAADTDMTLVHMEDFGLDYAETLRRWRANFEERPGAPGRAGLRRALPAHVADVPLLLRGGLHRAADRRRAARCSPSPAGARRLSGSAGPRASARRRRAGRRPRRRRAPARRRAARASGGSAASDGAQRVSNACGLISEHARPSWCSSPSTWPSSWAATQTDSGRGLPAQLAGEQHVRLPAARAADRGRVAEAVVAARGAQRAVVDLDDHVRVARRVDPLELHAARRTRSSARRRSATVRRMPLPS